MISVPFALYHTHTQCVRMNNVVVVVIIVCSSDNHNYMELSNIEDILDNTEDDEEITKIVKNLAKENLEYWNDKNIKL